MDYRKIIQNRSSKSLCELTNSKLKKMKTVTKSSQLNTEKYENLRVSVHNLNKWLRTKEDTMKMIMKSDREDREIRLKSILDQIDRHQKRLKNIVEIADKVFENHTTDQEIYIVNEYTKYLSIRFTKLQKQIERDLKRSDLKLLSDHSQMILTKIHDYQNVLSKYDNDFNKTNNTNSYFYYYHDKSNNDKGEDVDNLIIVDTNNNHEINNHNNNIINACNQLILKYRILFKKYKDDVDSNISKLEEEADIDLSYKHHWIHYIATSEKLEELEQNIEAQATSMLKTLGSFAILSYARQIEMTDDEIIKYEEVKSNKEADFETMNFQKNSRVYHEGVDLNILRWRNFVKTISTSSENIANWQYFLDYSACLTDYSEINEILHPTNPVIIGSRWHRYASETLKLTCSQMSYQLVPRVAQIPPKINTNPDIVHDAISASSTVQSHVHRISEEIKNIENNTQFYENLQVTITILLQENKENLELNLHDHYLKMEELSKNGFQEKYVFLNDDFNAIDHITYLEGIGMEKEQEVTDLAIQYYKYRYGFKDILMLIYSKLIKRDKTVSNKISLL